MSKIKQLREAAKIKQKELADTLHISSPSLWAWENGKTMPKADRLPEIAKALGCTIDDLFDKEDDNMNEMKIRDFIKLFSTENSAAANICIYLYADEDMFKRDSYMYHYSKTYRVNDEEMPFEMQERPYADATIKEISVWHGELSIKAIMEG